MSDEKKEEVKIPNPLLPTGSRLCEVGVDRMAIGAHTVRRVTTDVKESAIRSGDVLIVPWIAVHQHGVVFPLNDRLMLVYAAKLEYAKAAP